MPKKDLKLFLKAEEGKIPNTRMKKKEVSPGEKMVKLQQRNAELVACLNKAYTQLVPPGWRMYYIKDSIEDELFGQMEKLIVHTSLDIATRLRGQ